MFDILRVFLLLEEAVLVVMYGTIAYKSYCAARVRRDALVRKLCWGSMFLGIGLCIKAAAISITIFNLHQIDIRPILWQISAVFMMMGWRYLFANDFRELTEYMERRPFIDRRTRNDGPPYGIERRR